MPEDTKKRVEYAPITQELRDYCEHHVSLSVHCGAILDMCDNIDAIHKALEDASAEMREFCNRLEDAAKKREDLTIFGTDYTALPLDADGVPIHVGDVMDTSAFGTVEVEGFIHSAIAFYNYNEDQQARLCTSPAKLCHHHKPTVADVLREFADGIKDQNADFTELAIAEYAKRLKLAEGDAE